MASTYTGKVPKDTRKMRSIRTFEELPQGEIRKKSGPYKMPKPKRGPESPSAQGAMSEVRMKVVRKKQGDDGYDYLKHHKEKFGIKE